MTVIPLRTLRNEVSAVLRRAEAGEHFTITVDGRPVAELGPIRKRPRFADPSTLTRIFANKVDAGWADDLRRMRDEDEAAAEDVWRDR